MQHAWGLVSRGIAALYSVLFTPKCLGTDLPASDWPCQQTIAERVRISIGMARSSTTQSPPKVTNGQRGFHRPMMLSRCVES